MKNATLSLGTDPEFVLIDKTGAYKSAIEIIGNLKEGVSGNKESKIDLGNGHQMFYDNVLMELNVVSGKDEEGVVASLADCFRRASRMVRPYIMKPQASHIYPAKETTHPDARVFGCEPEFCGYEMCQLNPPSCEPGNNFRSAGGHIHLGYDVEAWPLLAPIKNQGKEDEDRNDRDWGRVWVVRMMDMFVGLPSLLVDHDETSAARRKLYGKAGTHRPKEAYGVEYRATSNFWLQSPKLTRLVYRLSAHAVDFVAKGRHLELWKDTDECTAYDVKALRDIIDDSNVAEAKTMLEKVVKKYLPAELFAEVFKLSEFTRYDFYKEWGLA